MTALDLGGDPVSAARDLIGWTLLVDGKSIRDIAKVLGISFRQAKKSIDQTRGAWREKQRMERVACIDCAPAQVIWQRRNSLRG